MALRPGGKQHAATSNGKQLNQARGAVLRSALENRAPLERNASLHSFTSPICIRDAGGQRGVPLRHGDDPFSRTCPFTCATRGGVICASGEATRRLMHMQIPH